MAEKKMIVVGATGAQGGGLVRAILNGPEAPGRGKSPLGVVRCC
jgi:hypothetical protein